MSIVCTKCHSTRVICEAYINPNDNTLDHYSDESFDYGCCYDCDEFVVLVDINDTVDRILYEIDKFRSYSDSTSFYAQCNVTSRKGLYSPHRPAVISVGKQNEICDKSDVFYQCHDLEDLINLAKQGTDDFMITEFRYFFD